MTAHAEFLHLASGESAGGAIKQALRNLGRAETVIAMTDSFEAGPLTDVDAGAASRIDWYRRIGTKPLDEAEARQFDDSEVWQRVRADPANVMLWHGPHPVERIFVLRACWHLRDQAQRVYEVAMPPSERQWKSRVRPRFYDAVGMAGPDVTVSAWDRRVKVQDVAARARRWEELRSEPGDRIRILAGEAIVSLPVTHHDAAIVRACVGEDWTDSLHLVGSILADNSIGLMVIVWRVRELIRTGVLECRGADNQIGLPAELRAVRPAITSA